MLFSDIVLNIFCAFDGNDSRHNPLERSLKLGGHIFCVERNNRGVLTSFDPQNGRENIRRGIKNIIALDGDANRHIIPSGRSNLYLGQYYVRIKNSCISIKNM